LGWVLILKSTFMKIIVIGGNFAGFTASLEIKRKLGQEADVLIIDRNPDFL